MSNREAFSWVYRDPRWQLARRIVLERDGYRCVGCGIAGQLEVDHMEALQDGGAKFDPANLQALCKSCHSVKTAAEWRCRRHGPDPPEVAGWGDLVAELG